MDCVPQTLYRVPFFPDLSRESEKTSPVNVQLILHQF